MSAHADADAVRSLARCLAAPVARGLLDTEAADAALVCAIVRRPSLHCHLESHLRVAAWQLQTSVNRLTEQRELDEYRVRRAIWPLCERRVSGGEVVALALRHAGRLPRADVIALCLDVAKATRQGAQHGKR